MTVKRVFAALVFLVILSTIIVAINQDSTETRMTGTAPVEISAWAVPISCIHPGSATEKTACATIEDQILATTVRIDIHAQYYSQGQGYPFIEYSHATIMGGRYLVTHNHFHAPLTGGSEGREIAYLAVSLCRADGALILEKSPLSAYEVVYSDPKTQVLEFLTPDGEGLFAALGLPSAKFVDWGTIHLGPDMQVAQIDWDGERAHVDWTRIDGLNLEGAAPEITLHNFARIGSSGGGVFWNGQHIGNNRAHHIVENPDTGEVTRQYSVVAVNSASLVEMDR